MHVSLMHQCHVFLKMMENWGQDPTTLTKKRWTKGVVAHQRRKSISHTSRLTPSGVQYDLQHFQNASHSFLKQLWFILCILCKIISLKRHIQMQNVSTILCCSCCIFQLFSTTSILSWGDWCLSVLVPTLMSLWIRTTPRSCNTWCIDPIKSITSFQGPAIVVPAECKVVCKEDSWASLVIIVTSSETDAELVPI